ncbi:MAG: hypothetical protein GY862_34075 [Gammaproteobacteria bacterium]|nr:hypothetical protein [Gammaproteobacteria bacterium]
MTANVSAAFMIWTVCCIGGDALAHLAYTRIYAKRSGSSPQGALFKIILLGNVPLVAGAILIGSNEGRPLTELLGMFFYCIIVYNCFLYAYFHFFNMSETARRIKMVLYLRDHNGLEKHKLLAMYSPEDMVQVRLRRIVKMGWAAETDDGKYVVKNKFAAISARLFQMARRIIVNG